MSGSNSRKLWDFGEDFKPSKKANARHTKEAYRWLQTQLGLPEAEAHIARFSEFRCQQVTRLCRKFIAAQNFERRNAA